MRSARPGDAAAVARIGRRAYVETHADMLAPGLIATIVERVHTPHAVEAAIRRCRATAGAHFLVAERERVVGFLQFDRARGEPELRRLYLEPGARRRGIGSLLLAELERRLEPDTSYTLMVVEANVAAIRFYRRHGLRVERRVDGIAHRRGAASDGEPHRMPCLIMRHGKPAAAPRSG